MAKKLTIALIITVFLGVGAFIILNSPTPHAEEIKQAGPPPVQDELMVEQMTIQTSSGEKHIFEIEIARTPAEQAYGLMNRKSMAADHGMLFLFQVEDERAFWMRNTLIPLDMVFIKADGTIHSIHENAIPHDLTPVKSNGAVLAVLELNGGQTAALGIKPGNKVFYRAFQPQP